MLIIGLGSLCEEGRNRDDAYHYHFNESFVPEAVGCDARLAAVTGLAH